MNSQFNLNIKTPCSENFNKFSPTPNGGFCGSCQKEVIDFTKMNAQQIVNHFEKKQTQNTCGRFKSNQLNTNLQKRKKISFWAGIGLACLSFFSIHSAKAQVVINPLKSPDQNPQDIKAAQYEKNIKVKGIVSDASIPLPGVNVVLEGTTIGTQTNFDGEFEFPEKLKKGDVLVFSYLGMSTQKAVITDEQSSLQIELKMDMTSCEMIIMGKVAVKQIYKSKKD